MCGQCRTHRYTRSWKGTNGHISHVLQCKRLSHTCQNLARPMRLSQLELKRFARISRLELSGIRVMWCDQHADATMREMTVADLPALQKSSTVSLILRRDSSFLSTLAHLYQTQSWYRFHLAAASLPESCSSSAVIDLFAPVSACRMDDNGTSEWDLHKETLRKLYMVKKSRLQDIMEFMEAQHGFRKK